MDTGSQRARTDQPRITVIPGKQRRRMGQDSTTRLCGVVNNSADCYRTPGGNLWTVFGEDQLKDLFSGGTALPQSPKNIGAYVWEKCTCGRPWLGHLRDYTRAPNGWLKLNSSQLEILFSGRPLTDYTLEEALAPAGGKPTEGEEYWSSEEEDNITVPPPRVRRCKGKFRPNGFWLFTRYHMWSNGRWGNFLAYERTSGPLWKGMSGDEKYAWKLAAADYRGSEHCRGLQFWEKS